MSPLGETWLNSQFELADIRAAYLGVDIIIVWCGVPVLSMSASHIASNVVVPS